MMIYLLRSEDSEPALPFDKKFLVLTNVFHKRIGSPALEFVKLCLPKTLKTTLGCLVMLFSILHAQKSAEMTMTARSDTGQVRFKCPEPVLARAGQLQPVSELWSRSEPIRPCVLELYQI
eukprot:6186447-Pleurochrysis_carterae.AAC.5